MSMDEIKRRGNYARLGAVVSLGAGIGLGLYFGLWFIFIIGLVASIFFGWKVVKNMAETGRRF